MIDSPGIIDFDSHRIARLRRRAEAIGLGLLESPTAHGRYALYSHDRRLYVVPGGSRVRAPRLTLTDVDAALSDIESRLEPV
jgi:hypothetical protein